MARDNSHFVEFLESWKDSAILYVRAIASSAGDSLAKVLRITANLKLGIVRIPFESQRPQLAESARIYNIHIFANFFIHNTFFAKELPAEEATYVRAFACPCVRAVFRV
jgi:hypothetical protein